jgi:hypothetical protein
VTEIVSELPKNEERGETARLVLMIGLGAALLPSLLALGTLLLYQAGFLDWWTAYGQVLIGDGRGLPLALQASLVAVIATLVCLGVTLWAGIERFYARAMLNLAITAASVWALVAIAG